MKNSVSLNWLKDKIKNQRLSIWILIITNAIFSALLIAFAFAIKGVIDGAVEGGDAGKQKLIYSAIALGVIVLLQFILRIVNNGLSERIKGKITVTLRGHLFGEILKKKYDKASSYHSGDLMTRLTNDVEVISSGLVAILPNLIAAVFRLVLAVIALSFIDYIFAIAFCVAGVLVFTVLCLLRGKLKSLHKTSQKTDGETRSYMQESIENLLAVKVFSSEEKVEAKAEALQQVNFDVKMKRKNYSVLGHAAYNAIFSMGYLFALIYGAVMIFNGNMAYGTLSAILQLVNNVQVPFMSLSGVIPQYYAMIASTERILEIENLENEPTIEYRNRDEVYSSMQSICLKHVSFSYDREVIFSDTSVQIDKGDFVAITGISGIGKSTLFKLLLGVYQVGEGEISFKLANQTISVDNSTRNLFAYVPQGNMLFSGTLRDNVTFIAPNSTEEQIAKALEISCVNDFIGELPKGLDTVVGEKGVGLSEGQIQRVAIARALLSNAPIILLDEATSALDEATERQLLTNLKTLSGVTLITITHKKLALSICNKVLEIEDKKIISK